MSRGLRVAVVGATGVVGTTMRALLREREFPGERDRPICLAALRRPRARTAQPVRPLSDGVDIDGFDLALFSAGAGVSREWGPRFVAGRRHRGRQLLCVPPRSRRSRWSCPRSTRTRSSTTAG